MLNIFKPHRKPHRTASFFETETAPQTASPIQTALQTAPQKNFQTATAPQTAGRPDFKPQTEPQKRPLKNQYTGHTSRAQNDAADSTAFFSVYCLLLLQRENSEIQHILDPDYYVLRCKQSVSVNLSIVISLFFVHSVAHQTATQTAIH